jgi:voltage-gated potassium channel
MIKAKIKINPFTFVITTLILLIASLGIAMRNIERYHSTEFRVFQFDNVYNTIWCIILAITTIGYGDIYPISIGGRLIVIIAGITGSVILSILINIIQALTTFIPNENDAYEFLCERQKI